MTCQQLPADLSWLFLPAVILACCAGYAIVNTVNARKAAPSRAADDEGKKP